MKSSITWFSIRPRDSLGIELTNSAFLAYLANHYTTLMNNS